MRPERRSNNYTCCTNACMTDDEAQVAGALDRDRVTGRLHRQRSCSPMADVVNLKEIKKFTRASASIVCIRSSHAYMGNSVVMNCQLKSTAEALCASCRVDAD